MDTVPTWGLKPEHRERNLDEHWVLYRYAFTYNCQLRGQGDGSDGKELALGNGRTATQQVFCDVHKHAIAYNHIYEQ